MNKSLIALALAALVVISLLPAMVVYRDSEQARLAGIDLDRRLQRFQEIMRKADASIKASNEEFARWYKHIDDKH